MASYSKQLLDSSGSLNASNYTLKVAEKALASEIEESATLASLTRHLRLKQLTDAISRMAVLEREVSKCMSVGEQSGMSYTGGHCHTIRIAMEIIQKDTSCIIEVADKISTHPQDRHALEENIRVIHGSSEDILNKLEVICTLIPKKTDFSSGAQTAISKQSFLYMIEEIREKLPLKYVVSFRGINSDE